MLSVVAAAGAGVTAEEIVAAGAGEGSGFRRVELDDEKIGSGEGSQ